MEMQSTTQFLVHVCAIVGGFYAVSSLIESALRNSLSIFGFGEPSEAERMGQGLKPRRKVKKVVDPPSQIEMTS